MDKELVTYFCIVKFKCDKTISVIPKRWITNTDENNAMCYWPRVCNKQQVQKCVPPSYSWPKYEIKVMKQCETYEAALAAESKLLTTENTESEFEEVEKKKHGKRKQKQKKRYTDFHIDTPPSLQSLSSSEEGEILDNPQSPINEMDIFLQETIDNVPIMEATNVDIAAAPIVIAESSQYVNSFEQSVINHLLEIKATQQAHYNIIMDRLNRMGLSSSSIGPTNYDLLPPLPCTTLVDIQEFEKLLSNADVYKQLELKLSGIGGMNAKNCVGRCLSILFNNQVSQQCSWTGQKHNFKIKELNMTNAIKGAVIKSFPDMTERKFEEAVMNWFRYAAQRAVRETK